MPRKFNDPIMKSLNRSQSSGSKTDGTEKMPGYIPANIKNGIDKAELPPELQDLMSDWQQPNETYSIGDYITNLSLLGLVGGGNISLMDDSNVIWLQMPISNRKTSGSSSPFPGVAYSLNILLQTVDVDAAEQKLIVNGNAYDSFFPARRVGLEQGYSSNSSGYFFQPFHSSEYTRLTPGTESLYVPTALQNAGLSFSFLTSAELSSPYLSNDGYASEITAVPFPTGAISTESKRATMADSPLTYVSLSGTTVSNYSVYDMRVDTMRIYIKDES